MFLLRLNNKDESSEGGLTSVFICTMWRGSSVGRAED